MKSLKQYLNENLNFDQSEISKLKSAGYELNSKWKNRYSKNGQNIDKINNTHFRVSVDDDDFEKNFKNINDFIAWDKGESEE